MAPISPGLRPPIPEYMLFGGMMIAKADIRRCLGGFRSLKNFAHAARLMGRYLARPAALPARHAADDGNALTARLFYSLKQRGIEILFDVLIAD